MTSQALFLGFELCSQVLTFAPCHQGVRFSSWSSRSAFSVHDCGVSSTDFLSRRTPSLPLLLSFPPNMSFSRNSGGRTKMQFGSILWKLENALPYESLDTAASLCRFLCFPNVNLSRVSCLNQWERSCLGELRESLLSRSWSCIAAFRRKRLQLPS